MVARGKALGGGKRVKKTKACNQGKLPREKALRGLLENSDLERKGPSFNLP